MVTDNHYRWDFIGLSTDVKPTPSTSSKVSDGSTFYCSDNSKLYVWYKNQWYERTAAGGGGTSYTAGSGITISDDTISVDTTTIQPKLTAGSNITIDADNVISATGGSSVNVVQSTGTSTTDVMSQNAVTSMIFSNPATATNISIGNSNAGTDALSIGVSAYGAGNYSIALGDHSNTYSGSEAIAVGHSARARKTGAIAIGYNTNDGEEGHIGSIALGATAKTDGVGQLNIGATSTDYGYNGNSNYRIIRGVYDGQLSHDAVTLGQLNTRLGNLTITTISQSDYNNLQTKDPNTLYLITGA